MVYFATSFLNASGGIMVTASHNPADYNGLKFVREEARPISADTGLADIRQLAEGDDRKIAPKPGSIEHPNIFEDYIEHMLTYVDVERLKPLKLVVNAGNGCAGIAVVGLENRAATIEAVRANDADMGIAWDGDFDRCFLFDEKGGFIEGYYIVGLLAESLLKHHPGGKIIHDPRLTWNTLDIVAKAGGVAVQSKSGHSFIKEKMREVDGLYGGEMSAHHYFRNFSYADSGMIPWLLVAELIGQTGKPLSELVGERQAMFPTSGEINRTVDDAKVTLQALHDRYSGEALNVDDTDGYSFEFADWRFNIRMSNTEPVVRLNLETRGDQALMEEKTREVLAVMEGG
jgi:phosphomannomutase